MGCGVSKENITEPTRIQTVVVNAGSPQSHLKAHEAARQQNHGLVCLVGTQSCQEPSIIVLEENSVSSIGPNDSPLQISSLGVNGELQPFECHQVEDNSLEEHDSSKEEEKEDLLQSITRRNDPCDDISPQLSTQISDGPCDDSPRLTPIQNAPFDQTPRGQHVANDSLLFCSSNGLVGTLANLDEIFGAQEAVSLKLAIKVTAEKIMSYGGVLHSLEDQVGDFTSPSECNTGCNGDDGLNELEHEANEGQAVLGSSNGNHDRMESPTLTSPKPILENFPKKLPPILSSPSCALNHHSLPEDPFEKSPFPIHCQPRIEEIQDLIGEPPPSSPQLPHTTQMVEVEKLKDILVMDGGSCGKEENQSSMSMTFSKGPKYDVDSFSALKGASGSQESSHGSYDSNMDPICQKIIISNLIPQFEHADGFKPSSPLFSTCRIEYLEEGNIKPLSSEEFYS